MATENFPGAMQENLELGNELYWALIPYLLLNCCVAWENGYVSTSSPVKCG